MRPTGTATIALAVALSITAKAETPVERGKYLVTTIGSCGNCHTPREGNVIGGKVVPGTELSGGSEIVEPGLGPFIPPNITPDTATGIGEWTKAQIVDALRNGRRPDGKLIGPPMPIPVYRELSDNDASAIAAYLVTLKPIKHEVPRTVYTIPLPPNYGPPVIHVAEPSRTDKVAYGKYLATFGHCVLCHTPPGKNEPFDMSRAFAGGRALPGGAISRNITSDAEDGVGKWTDEQIKVAITQGKRPDGTALNRVMAFDWYKGIAPADLDSMVAYLRTIPPQKTPPPQTNP
jgi:mono/diheme cytochrome c family protein